MGLQEDPGTTNRAKEESDLNTSVHPLDQEIPDDLSLSAEELATARLGHTGGSEFFRNAVKRAYRLGLANPDGSLALAWEAEVARINKNRKALDTSEHPLDQEFPDDLSLSAEDLATARLGHTGGSEFFRRTVKRAYRWGLSNPEGSMALKWEAEVARIKENRAEQETSSAVD